MKFPAAASAISVLCGNGFKTSDQVQELKVPKVKALLRSIFYFK
jgi:hypothetical protein